MRKNTGMSYKRRQRQVSINKARLEMLYWKKRNYIWHEAGMSFDEYVSMEPKMVKAIHQCGRYSKKSYHCGRSSTVYNALFWYSFYSPRDIRDAHSALSAYDEFELSDEAANRSEAYRKAHNADRKAAKHRKFHK